MRINLILFTILAVISLNVLGQQKQSQVIVKDSAYPYSKGNLLFNKEHVKMNYVKNTEIRRDSLLFINNSSRPLTLSLKPTPAYMECSVSPPVLEPGMTGKIMIDFNAAKKDDFGYSYESVVLMTNDSIEPEKFFFVMVYIEEDFSGLTKEQRDNAPGISFKNEIYEYGTIRQGEKVDCYFEFSNKGKSDLIIRKTKASCGCTATEPEKVLLKPGESSKIHVVFDSTGLTGEQQKTVYVYSNDPRYSTVALQLKGIVKK